MPDLKKKADRSGSIRRAEGMPEITLNETRRVSKNAFIDLLGGREHRNAPLGSILHTVGAAGETVIGAGTTKKFGVFAARTY